MDAREGSRREDTRTRAIAIANRVRANARGGVSGRHGTGELVAAAAVLIGAGWSDPRDRVVMEEADAIAGATASTGRRTFAALPDPSDDLVALWEGIRAQLRSRFDSATFELWLAPLRPVALRDRRLLVAAPKSTAPWIQRRYTPVLRELADVDDVVVAAYDEDNQ